MEKEKTSQILNRCLVVFKECQTTIQWLTTFVKENPSIVEIPEEVLQKITNTQLDIFDVKILLENTLKSLGNEEQNE